MVSDIANTCAHMIQLGYSLRDINAPMGPIESLRHINREDRRKKHWGQYLLSAQPLKILDPSLGGDLTDAEKKEIEADISQFRKKSNAFIIFRRRAAEYRIINPASNLHILADEWQQMKDHIDPAKPHWATGSDRNMHLLEDILEPSVLAARDIRFSKSGMELVMEKLKRHDIGSIPTQPDSLAV